MDPAGNAIVAWRTSRSLQAFFSTGERWTPLLRVVSPDLRRLGSTAVGRHGSVAVVSWTLFNDGSVPGFHGVAEWFGRRIDLASGLAEDTSFTRGTTGAAATRVDPAGRVLALGNAGAAPGSQFIRYEPGAGWQEPEAMGAYSVMDAALDFSGRLLVLLRGRDDASFRDLTLAREWAVGRGWSDLETALGPSELLGTVPLRIDPTSRATLALARRRPAELQLVRRGSSAWVGEPVPGLLQTLWPGCPAEARDWCVSSSLLALEPGGGAWVAWQQQDEGRRNSLWVQRRLPDAR